uniref:RING-type E3 ubiquitin transferase n=1 Tax=Oncorhynchus tshawytscha TaxID=74940 RepID=A0A8C8JL48_ONCTS
MSGPHTTLIESVSDRLSRHMHICGLLEVILQGSGSQTCAACLEDFKVKDELGVLPCQHTFYRKCLVKWLEVRCVCPMCNKLIAGPPEQRHSIGTLLDELV